VLVCLRSIQELRRILAEAAPSLGENISTVVSPWIRPILDRLALRGASHKFPKTINDPIWGVIELYPWESLILDSPLLQRLRRIRQLGMAHYVYPGAVHNRLEHTLGVVEAAERMVRALQRNAKHHQKFGDRPDTAIPEPSDMEIYSTRLAGLLHDIGHGPFSHVTEPLLRSHFAPEFDQAEQVLRQNFDGVTKIATSETIAVLIVLSDSMRQVFEHPKLGLAQAAELAPAVAARILGSRSYLTATYLSGVVSGPLDADKIDYMARDSHHSGLPIGLDMNRLISKLEVIILTPDNAFNPELRERATRAPNQRFYEMGISLSGLGAYEQMIIGRVILYDRLYYHHKVRAAESMVRSLVRIVGEETRTLQFNELITTISDDATVAVLTGDVSSEKMPSGGPRAKAAGTEILNRAIYHRAFAFAARFLGGLGGLPPQEQKDTRALLWNEILESLSSDEECDRLARAIYDRATELSQRLPDLAGMSHGLSPEHILIDLPINKAVVRGGDILTCDERGIVGTPNLYFDPEKWSQAYEQQKQVGFVFTPNKYIPLVALASRIVFFERFHMVTTTSGESASKTAGIVRREWMTQAGAAGLCSAECIAVLTEVKPNLLRLHADELRFPEKWRASDPGLMERIAEGFAEALPGGMPASVYQAVINGLEHMATFVQMTEEGGIFVGIDSLNERDLQVRLRDHLRSREVQVQEGAEVGGGETDLVIPGPLVIENKARDRTTNPLGAGSNYPWQTRRYAIAMVAKVMFLVVAYRPATENDILDLTQRIAVVTPGGAPQGYAQVKVLIPWGHPVPSRAQKP